MAAVNYFLLQILNLCSMVFMSLFYTDLDMSTVAVGYLQIACLLGNPLIFHATSQYSQRVRVAIDGVSDSLLDLLTALTQLVITFNFSVIANLHILQTTVAHILVFSVYLTSPGICF
jgi:hypothetical protein